MNDGYDTSWFADENSIKEYICSICTNVAKMATTTECDHIFCTACITEWFTKKKECPMCKMKNPSITKNTFTDKRILDLKVHPENRKKRKHDAEEEVKQQTLKERLNLQKTWCILCEQELYPDEHVTCPSRDGSVDGINLMEHVVSESPLIHISWENILKSTNMLATEWITADYLKSFKPLVVSDKWASLTVEVRKPGTVGAMLTCGFLVKQSAQAVADMSYVHNYSVLRISALGKISDMFNSSGETTRDDITKCTKKLSELELKTLANALLDLGVEKFQFLVYYNLVIKPPE